MAVVDVCSQVAAAVQALKVVLLCFSADPRRKKVSCETYEMVDPDTVVVQDTVSVHVKVQLSDDVSEEDSEVDDVISTDVVPLFGSAEVNSLSCGGQSGGGGRGPPGRGPFNIGTHAPPSSSGSTMISSPLEPLLVTVSVAVASSGYVVGL